VFDQAVAAIKLAKAAGVGVYTNSTFFNTDSPQAVIDVLNYLNDELKVDRMEISPATRMRRRRPRTGSSAWSRPASCSGPRSPRGAGRSGG
jgi:sulfatase maturation enzyme AslB (radical SAM superfamily)